LQRIDASKYYFYNITYITIVYIYVIIYVKIDIIIIIINQHDIALRKENCAKDCNVRILYRANLK